MKIAIISDIHGNLEALRAVLNKIDSLGCMRVLCAGDVVGYGGAPATCVDILRERQVLTVRGNHDELVLNAEQENELRPAVKHTIQWSRNVLPKNAKQWLASLPEKISYADFDLVHGSHAYRPKWHYVVNAKTSIVNFLFQTRPLSFNGHTHVPLFVSHEREQRPHIDFFSELQLVRGRKYLINVGSVGQPRDRNPKASFVVYDTRSRVVTSYRVIYDIEKAQERIRDARLPHLFADRLVEGR